MLYIALGNAIVAFFSLLNSGSALYSLLCFDKALILQGQVWRLFTYVFTQSSSGLLGLIFIYFFYMIGRHVELSMGTLKFNLFYLSGVLLMDVFAMIFCPMASAASMDAQQNALSTALIYLYQGSMAYYLHLSLILAYATLHPDSQFLIFFIIPIRGWIIALVYIVLVVADIFNLSYPVFLVPHNLVPLVALGNYLLFMGKDIPNLFPKRYKRSRPQARSYNEPIQFRKTARPKAPDYTHKCTICGKTDVSNPELEFRYCSRCNGYHCYCQNHISNHEHIL